MLITRKSVVSGKVVTKEIDVTDAQMLAYTQGEVIQKAMPNISPDEREFILTGITTEEWRELFTEDD